MKLRPTPSVAAAALIALAGGAAVIVAGACATEETVLFAEPDEVAGGTGPGGSVTTGGPTCTPDPNCGVSFETDVFPILDAETKCGDPNGCHAASLSGFEFDAMDAAAAHDAIVTYQLDGDAGPEPYVVPCDPDGSRLLCNLKLEDGLTNSFGECGVLMPQADPSVMPTPLTQMQLDTISAWIECGAPQN